MGAHSFTTNPTAGANVQEAYDIARCNEDNDMDGKASGLVLIQREPVTVAEAYAIARDLFDKDDHRIADKWGPAGAIPVIMDHRTTTVEAFDYTPADKVPYGESDPNLLAAVKPLVKLKRGEKISRVNVHSYQESNRYSTYYRGPRARRGCRATVVIDKAPTTRKVTVTAKVDVSDDHAKIQAQGEMAATLKVKLATGEKVVSVSRTELVTHKPKVTSEAPKGKTVTKYIVPNTAHATWENGFDSQADARAWVTKALENVKGWDAQRALVEYEVLGLTKRYDGQPLVRAKRVIATGDATFEVTVALPQPANVVADGWIFFGYAPD